MTRRRRVKGLDRVLDKFGQLPEAVAVELRKAVAENALELDTELKKVINRGSRSGRTYLKGKTKRQHTASAPGEPPATDTGQLVRHINHQISKGGLVATVGIHELGRVKYAAWLEFGTKRIKPRPWLFPTFERLRRKFRDRHIEAVRRGHRNAR